MVHTFSVSLAALLSILCIIGAAILLRRKGRIDPATDHGLTRLTIDLLMPCLIFDKILKTDAFSDAQNLWLPPILGFGLTAVGILFGFLVALIPGKLTGLASWKQKRTFAACVGILNYGFVPVPLVEMLFPDNRTMGVLFLQYLGVEISVWTLVLFTLIGRFDAKSWRHVITCPVLAILTAVPLNLIGQSSLVPAAFFEHIAPCFDFLLMAIHLLGQAAIPVSLLAIGLTVSDMLHRKEIVKRWKVMAKRSIWSCLVRLCVMPCLFLALACFLPCTVEIKRVLVIYGAMGSAIFPVVLARLYDAHAETALDTIMGNTLASLLTLPVWIAIGLHLVG